MYVKRINKTVLIQYILNKVALLTVKMNELFKSPHL